MIPGPAALPNENEPATLLAGDDQEENLELLDAILVDVSGTEDDEL